MKRSSRSQSGEPSDGSSVQRETRPYWLGCDSIVPSYVALPAIGLNQIDVVCRAPRYVTLHIDFDGDTIPSLSVPLEPEGQHRYRRSFAIAGRPKAAWLEIIPASTSEDIESVDLRPLGWMRLHTLGWRAALRHATQPRLLLAKMRQALGGSGSLMFAGDRRRAVPDDVIYHRWQQAFESESEIARITGAFEDQCGHGGIRTLVVVKDWTYGDAALNKTLASLCAAHKAEVHVLCLTQHPPRVALQDAVAVATWQHVAPDAADWSSVAARAAEGAEAAIVLLLDRPGEFAKEALICLALALALDAGAVAAYADHDWIDSAGCRHSPVFKPGWSPDYQAARGYVAQPIAFRGDPALFASMGESGAASHSSVSMLAHVTSTSAVPRTVQHVPRILFHELEPDSTPSTGQGCREAGDKAEHLAEERAARASVPGSIVQTHPGCTLPEVSVVIPSKDNPQMLAQACRSALSARDVRAEVIIVDNGSVSQAQKEMLASLAADPRCRVLTVSRPFNFSQLINVGRANSRRGIVVALNDDVEAIDDQWLHVLASQAARPEIGCVGALLLYPDGRVQHAGVVLGINGGAGHAFRFAPAEAPGRSGLLKAVHEVSAVTGACLAVRASVFDEVGGFSEDLPVTLNDVDFCLRVRAHGYRNIFTPHARLIHRESTSRGLDNTPERLQRLAHETALFRRRWGKAALDDPYYSPHLSRGHEDFRLRAL